MNERTRIYFDDLAERAVSAKPVPREVAPDARPNACHPNCETFALRFPEFEVVRGWLALDAYWFMPHSVVREIASGRLIDITPEPNNSAIPFVEHRGSEMEFAELRKGRDGGWLYPQPTADFAALNDDSDNFCYTNTTQPNEVTF